VSSSPLLQGVNVQQAGGVPFILLVIGPANLSASENGAEDLDGRQEFG
jgi:hypothetical protein